MESVKEINASLDKLTNNVHFDQPAAELTEMQKAFIDKHDAIFKEAVILLVNNAFSNLNDINIIFIEILKLLPSPDYIKWECQERKTVLLSAAQILLDMAERYEELEGIID